MRYIYGVCIAASVYSSPELRTSHVYRLLERLISVHTQHLPNGA